MFKTATVSFRTKQELLALLDDVSRESGCSRSSLIEMILRKFLSDNGGNEIQSDNLGEIKGGEHGVDVGELSGGVSSELCKLVKPTKHRRWMFGKEEKGADA